jgi:hypothetical protein
MTEDILSVFRGRCGHQWVGASNGSFACPKCGDHEGDHHLVSSAPIAVQVDDFGCGAWEELIHKSIGKRANVGQGEKRACMLSHAEAHADVAEIHCKIAKEIIQNLKTK